MNSHSNVSFQIRDFVSFFIRTLCVFLFCCCWSGCEKEKSISQTEKGEMIDFYLNTLLKTDEFMHTNEAGDFLVDYEVEFLPMEESDSDAGISQGVLRISLLSRKERADEWQVKRPDFQVIPFPIEDTLPVFFITDNLQIDDANEGYRLNFYNCRNELIRTVSYSVEDWLLLIGEIRQSHYGYLEVDLSVTPHDLLSLQ